MALLPLRHPRPPSRRKTVLTETTSLPDLPLISQGATASLEIRGRSAARLIGFFELLVFTFSFVFFGSAVSGEIALFAPSVIDNFFDFTESNRLNDISSFGGSVVFFDRCACVEGDRFTGGFDDWL
jgi:hypothetical protein